jgi:hypothetical protein
VETSARKGAAGERKLAASAVLHTAEDLGDITIIALVEAPRGGSRSLTATSTPTPCRGARSPGSMISPPRFRGSSIRGPCKGRRPLLSFAGPLYAEGTDATTGHDLGTFPQAFTHLGPHRDGGDGVEGDLASATAWRQGAAAVERLQDRDRVDR